MSSLENILKEQNYLRTPFLLTVTNHLEVSARINGIEGRFLVDTGASSTCIGSDRLALFGLHSEDSDVKAAGAGATNMDTAVSSGNHIEIGDWSVADWQLVLFDLSHVNHALELHNADRVDGIIGGDLLEKSGAVIDYLARYLYLGPVSKQPA